MKKNYVLFVTAVGTVLLFLFENAKFISFCSDNYKCIDMSIKIGRIFLIFPFILIFSLITYFAPERVFASWWKFARISIPVAFIANALLMYDMSKSTDAFDDIVYIPVLILIYGSFTLGSVWQIWKGWRNK